MGEGVATLLDLGELSLRLLDLAARRSHRARSTSPRPRPARFASAISSDTWFGSRAGFLDLGQQLAAAGVELEELVEVSAGAAALERCSGRARVVADRAAGRARAARPYWPSAPACCSSDWISLVPPGFGGRFTSPARCGSTGARSNSPRAEVASRKGRTLLRLLCARRGDVLSSRRDRGRALAGGAARPTRMRSSPRWSAGCGGCSARTPSLGGRDGYRIGDVETDLDRARRAARRRRRGSRRHPRRGGARRRCGCSRRARRCRGGGRRVGRAAPRGGRRRSGGGPATCSPRRRSTTGDARRRRGGGPARAGRRPARRGGGPRCCCGRSSRASLPAEALRSLRAAAPRPRRRAGRRSRARDPGAVRGGAARGGAGATGGARAAAGRPAAARRAATASWPAARGAGSGPAGHRARLRAARGGARHRQEPPAGGARRARPAHRAARCCAGAPSRASARSSPSRWSTRWPSVGGDRAGRRRSAGPRPARPVLGRLVPELAPFADAAPAPPGRATAAVERSQSFAAVAGFLRGLAREQPGAGRRRRPAARRPVDGRAPALPGPPPRPRAGAARGRGPHRRGRGRRRPAARRGDVAAARPAAGRTPSRYLAGRAGQAGARRRGHAAHRRAARCSSSRCCGRWPPGDAGLPAVAADRGGRPRRRAPARRPSGCCAPPPCSAPRSTRWSPATLAGTPAAAALPAFERALTARLLVARGPAVRVRARRRPGGPARHDPVTDAAGAARPGRRPALGRSRGGRRGTRRRSATGRGRRAPG